MIDPTMFKNRKKLLTIGLFALLSFNLQARELSPVIQVQNGELQGYREQGQLKFQGIPYAEPPISERRWQEPVPKRQWGGKYYAGHLGNSCATNSTLGGFSKLSDSEDCLYLNVYVPDDSSAQPLKYNYPVLFVIPGGGLQTGSGDEYDASYFTQKGIIVVTMNFRLGPFGFFYNPSLETSRATPVNLGLMDQQLALKWINQNIHAFGGDPKNITIFGESAGGQSVAAHIISPLSKGLFQRAISASGPYHTDTKDLNDAKKVTQTIAKSLGCYGTPQQISTCLKSKPTEAFLSTEFAPLFSDGFYLDQTTLFHPYAVAFEKNQFNKVDLISGYNQDEGTLFAGVFENEKGTKLDWQDYEQILGIFYGKNARQDIFANTIYPANTDYTKQLAVDLGKYKFICPIMRFNNVASSKIPTYGYEFADHTIPLYIQPMSLPHGAYHTSELMYLFKDFHGATGHVQQLTPTQKQLSEKMLSYFSNFIKTGNPNAKGLTEWSRYNAKSQSSIQFQPSGAQRISNLNQKWNCR